MTGLNHNLSPGNFTTSLTLSYGDAYGKYRSVLNSITNTIENLQSKESKFQLLIENFTVVDSKSEIDITATRNNILHTVTKDVNSSKVDLAEIKLNGAQIQNITTITSESLEIEKNEELTIELTMIYVFLSTTKNIIGVGEHLGSLTTYTYSNKKVNFTSYIFRSESIDNFRFVEDYTMAFGADIIKKLNIKY